MEHLRIKSAVNANLQNTINRSLILHYVRKNTRSYRSEISRDLSLSLPAVSRAVDSLIQQGYLLEKKIVTKSGKQAHEVEINSTLGVSIGVSLQPPYIMLGKMDMAGNLVEIEETDISEHSETQLLQEHIIDLMDKHLPKSATDPPVAAICLSVPAAVERDQKRIYASLYSSMSELNLLHMLAERYRVPVFLENNENLCVLAEKYYQEGIPENDVVFITIHHGIGAGLLLGGQLYLGKNGAAGEIGQQLVGIHPMPGIDRTDTFETIASIHQIQQLALNSIHRGKGEELFKAAGYSYQHITHTLVSRLAAEGLPAAIEVLENYAEMLAVGIGTMLVTLNPELVILGGRLCELDNPHSLIIEPLAKQLAKRIPFPVPEIRMTRLNQDTAVIGACQLALENTILQEFPYIIDR